MLVTIMAWVLLLLGVVLQRYGLASFKLALGMMAIAVLLLLVAALMQGVSYWKTRQLSSLIGLFVAVLPVLFAALLIGPKLGAPPIHDVSTQPGELSFVKAGEDRKAGDNPLGQPSENVVAQQNKAYPDLKTLELTGLTLEEAFQYVKAASESLGWEATYEQSPNVLEAKATTPLMRFVDDVHVRLEQKEQTVTVDIRSASRVGVGDLGANASRIRAFRQRLLALVKQ